MGCMIRLEAERHRSVEHEAEIVVRRRGRVVRHERQLHGRDRIIVPGLRVDDLTLREVQLRAEILGGAVLNRRRDYLAAVEQSVWIERRGARVWGAGDERR